MGARDRSTSGIAALLAGLATAPGFAGGRIALPPVSQSFPSHVACAAELERQAEQDARAASPRVTSAQMLREVQVLTRGVETAGPDKRRYEVTILYQHGALRTDLSQYEISHSFDKVIRECDGATLTTTSEKGFTLSTFEPVPEGASKR